MTEKQEKQLADLKSALEANVDNIVAHLQEQDRIINCTNVEWNPVSNDDNGMLGMYYVPYCKKREEVILDSKGCAKCELREKKFKI